MTLINGSGNGHYRLSELQSTTGRVLRPGVIPPIVTFFNADESIDTKTMGKHALRMLDAGCTGIVVLGSNGELQNIGDINDRRQIVKAARDAFTAAGREATPIIAGCSAMSARDVISNTKAVKEAGADFALVLPPSFYHQVLGKQNIVKFYHQVADASPIPLLVYNYPGAAAGIDLDSDDLQAIGQHPNIVGVKLTCNNSGKAARIARPSPVAEKKSIKDAFYVFAGTADWLTGGLEHGVSGVIPGVANVIPRLTVRCHDLWQQGRMDEARRLHRIIARADWAAQKQNLVGTKAAIPHFFGYGSAQCRSPLSFVQVSPEWLAEWAEAVEEEEKLLK